MKFLEQLWLAFALSLIAGGCTRAPQTASVSALEGVQVADLQGATFTMGQPPRVVKDRRISQFLSTFSGTEFQITRIENMDREAARQMLSQKKFQVQALYQEEKSPYPGFLSKNVKCPKQFQPEIDTQNGESESLLRVRAAANSRKSLGACDDAEMRFHAVLLLFYCDKLKLFLQIESFLPKSETVKASAFLRKVSC